jgi:hypothetical protein
MKQFFNFESFSFLFLESDCRPHVAPLHLHFSHRRFRSSAPVIIPLIWRTVATVIPDQNLIKITASVSEEVLSNIRHKTLVNSSQSVKHYT